MVMSAFSFTQPENSERSRDEHHFRGLTNPDINQKEYTKGFFVIWHCLSFPSILSSIFIFINLLKADVPSAINIRLFNKCFSSFWNSYETYKRIAFFKLLFL